MARAPVAAAARPGPALAEGAEPFLVHVVAGEGERVEGHHPDGGVGGREARDDRVQRRSRVPSPARGRGLAPAVAAQRGVRLGGAASAGEARG